MAKANRLEKSVESARKAVEATADRIRGANPPSWKAVGVTAVGVASTAGVVAAINLLRRHREGRTVFRVVQGDAGRWELRTDGTDEPLQTFERKSEAVAAGREAATISLPSGLHIHRTDGSLIASHTYEA